MNYSELSDFEINKAVAIACGYAEENCEFGWSGKPDVGVEWNEETGYPTKSFNYCNSWADAGPIIVSNLISLKPVSLFVGGHRWFATKGEGDFYIKAADNNPLRAAMIVFLMMQEKSNE
ncbi:phage protein NinX family protein [Pantoea stewartii subsp. indologenes]|uniref:phage protein NinX family protein n=1 Tax=Pantoea stewartii TaxID=66269 RepID=UPI003FA43A73